MTDLSYTWKNPNIGDSDEQGYVESPYWQGEMLKNALMFLVSRLVRGGAAVSLRSENWTNPPLDNMRGIKIVVELAEDGMTATATVVEVSA